MIHSNWRVLSVYDSVKGREGCGLGHIILMRRAIVVSLTLCHMSHLTYCGNNRQEWTPAKTKGNHWALNGWPDSNNKRQIFKRSYQSQPQDDQPVCGAWPCLVVTQLSNFCSITTSVAPNGHLIIHFWSPPSPLHDLHLSTIAPPDWLVPSVRVCGPGY